MKEIPTETKDSATFLYHVYLQFSLIAGLFSRQGIMPCRGIFSGTNQIFEALLERITQNDAMDFQVEINKETSAVKILEIAISQMEEEMKHSINVERLKEQ